MADGREAVGRTRGDRTAAAIVGPAQRDAVGVVMLKGGWVPEHVLERLVDAGQPAAKPVGGSVEHTFDRLGEPSDGKIMA